MSTYPQLLESGATEERVLVTVERNTGRALITLADPARLNSLTTGLVLQLRSRLAELAEDPSVRAIVITGEDPAFSAGGDLQMIETGSTRIRTPDEPADTTDAWRWIRRQFGGVVRTIASTDKPFIAAINGAAAGVGLAFALACDILVASEEAVLVPAFGRLGLVAPRLPGSARVIRPWPPSGGRRGAAPRHHPRGLPTRRAARDCRYMV
jgi:2-(1,2-epoxy-1,2-dihydrophenyl)acetyl-CoA isomerase